MSKVISAGPQGALMRCSASGHCALGLAINTEGSPNRPHFLVPPQSTFEFHYGKHHQAYVTNLNNQIAGKDLENLSIEEVSPVAG